jgi:hypothetical protein
VTNVEPHPKRVNVNGPPQFAMDGREVDYFIAVICTDRGQHKQVQLTMARRELDGSGGMNFALRHFAPPDPKARPESAVGRDSYIFWCPKCGRTPQVKRERWWRALDELARAGVHDLDISLLPL